jgi:26S proteasome regulatory subunit N2
VIVHGAALAIGMTGLASQDHACKEVLMDVLNMNNAVTGEAAGIAVGLLMAGSGDSLTLEELHRFARQSEHEKIIRSIALGSAIINFG